MRKSFIAMLRVFAGVLLAIPLTLLFAVWFYIIAVVEGLREMIAKLRGPKDGAPASEAYRKPHFMDAPNEPGAKIASQAPRPAKGQSPP